MYRIILDTETAGNVKDASTLRVYDIAYQVVDNHFQVVAQFRYFVKEIFGDSELMNSAYYARKLPQYYDAIERGEVEVRPWRAIMQDFATVCKAWKVKEVWAFNARFDRDSTNVTTEVLSNGFCTEFIPEGVEWKCIQAAAASTICMSSRYFKYAAAHNKVSKAGNVRTTAEVIYAYLTNNPSFKEAHTALEDVKIETTILQAVKRRHQRTETEPNRKAWRYPQDKFKAYYGIQ